MIRCDGGAEIGLGHIKRCLALADQLHASCARDVIFTMASGSQGFDFVKRAGYPVNVKGAVQDETEWLDALIESACPSILVLDVRTDLPLSAIQKWREAGILTAVIDDPSNRRLGANLAFYPPVPQIADMDWRNFQGELYADWPWVILGLHETLHPPEKKSTDNLTLLVTMGGTDPAGSTPAVLEALDTLDEIFTTVVVVGPGFAYESELEAVARKAQRNFEIRRNVSDMAAIMATADLAVASFGVTAYELAACGVPAIYLCLTPDHALSAQSFVQAGMGISLGVYADVSTADIAASVRALCDDGERRANMSMTGRRLLDGQGAVRIAQLLVGRVESHNVQS